MNNWLSKLAEQDISDEERLQREIESLPPSELQKLAYDLEVMPRPTHTDEMKVKIAEAYRMGQEMAHEHGDELEKQALAFLAPVLGMAGRALAGAGAKKVIGGVAKNVARDVASNAVTGAAGKAFKSVSAPQGGGGFSYGGGTPQYKIAGIMNAAAKGAGPGLLQRAAGYAVRNPGTAITAAGAVGGALMAPRDPQTGEKQYLRGAMMGGGLAAGANALSGGAIGNKARAAVMNNKNPLLGQGARGYMMDAAKATKGSYPKAARPGAAAAATPGAGPSTGTPTVAPAAAPTQAAAPAMRVAPAAKQAPAQAAAGPQMSDAHRAAQEAVAAGINVPAEMLHPDAQVAAGGGVNTQAGQMGDQMVSRQGLLGRLRGKMKNSPAAQAGAAADDYRGGPVWGETKTAQAQLRYLQDILEKKAFVLGGLAGHLAAGPDREASPRSGFWRGAAGDIAGTIAGGAIGGLAGDTGRLAGSLIGGLGGGYLAGRTARPTDLELKSHRAGQAAKLKALLKDDKKTKEANQQTLTYDPATKSFMRHHVTDDTSMGNKGNDMIPAGHSEPVGRGQQFSEHRGQVAPAGAAPSGGRGVIHSMHGGDVMSSSPRPGVPSRAVGTPPPIPMAARRAGPAGMAGAMAKPKLPSLAGAMSVARKI